MLNTCTNMLSYCVRKTLFGGFCTSHHLLRKDQALIYMVCRTCLSDITKHVKPKKRKGVTDRKERHFVDFAEIQVCGGKGGDGMLSFLSLPNQEWAGPDGGNGGNGGHVIFQASHNAKSLAHLHPTEKAKDGVTGRTKHRDGKNAEHHYVEVPLGTVVKSLSGQLLTSLDKHGDLFVAARGGAGGKGNYFFLSNENRAPAIAEIGANGQERQLFVELKTMAQAGLIGFPNAGKSSLLRAISRAQPAVSAYPFTTLNPHVGMVLYKDHEQLAVADIPGLIPGAHQNKGLGISFLRHIERCLCLIYVIDLAVEKPWQQLESLKFELNQYQPGLADRPNLLVGNKIDLPGASAKLAELKQRIQPETNESSNAERDETSMPILGVSAKKLTGIDEFLQHLRKLYEHYSHSQSSESSV